MRGPAGRATRGRSHEHRRPRRAIPFPPRLPEDLHRGRGGRGPRAACPAPGRPAATPSASASSAAAAAAPAPPRTSSASSPGVKLVAMGDVFKDRLDACKAQLAQEARGWPPMVDVPAERSFVGLDAYKKVIATDVDYVILATPPGFRPEHLAGRGRGGQERLHREAGGRRRPRHPRRARGLRGGQGEEARRRRRHAAAARQRLRRDDEAHPRRRHRRDRVRPLLLEPGRRSGTSRARPSGRDLEWQMRNWLYFTWLSGDHIVEQHVHNLDVVNWATNAHPVAALGMGGRQVRTGPGVRPHLRPLRDRLRVPERRRTC